MISTVSICGVDDSVAPEDLVEISAKYPFVEWGLNLCSNTEPRPAYPSDGWLEDLRNQADRLRVRGILQGRWERDMLNGILSLKEERPDIWDTIQRVQIDIRNGYTNLLDTLCLITDKEAILVSQTDNYHEVMGMQLNAFPLFTGLNVQSTKSTKSTKYCGYEITEKDLCKFNRQGDRFWISIDGFRHPNGITMNLLKVEKFLDKVEKFVTNDSWFRALLETNEMKKRFSLAEGIR